MRDKIVSTWSIAAVLVLFLTLAPLLPSGSHSKAALSAPPVSAVTVASAENCDWIARLNPFG